MGPPRRRATFQAGSPSADGPSKDERDANPLPPRHFHVPTDVAKRSAAVPQVPPSPRRPSSVRRSASFCPGVEEPAPLYGRRAQAASRFSADTAATTQVGQSLYIRVGPSKRRVGYSELQALKEEFDRLATGFGIIQQDDLPAVLKGATGDSQEEVAHLLQTGKNAGNLPTNFALTFKDLLLLLHDDASQDDIRRMAVVAQCNPQNGNSAAAPASNVLVNVQARQENGRDAYGQ
eukprot:CAMPEP_0117687420 /NCGR_PEP_ID=MMETSP0804-20121206/23126_1 /TAXON_ID=1074897 /ORGANISM="Tetraselmis astigmatica, Strain CCMP880" /LENGTH=233 /DNA_ID=CAMNT_0005499483 /DNA_START=458 /DNA_END=1158 /DNA_ORIENTATION=-